MGTLSLLWRFLGEQPAEMLFALVPWHLVAVLAVLGIFAALGVQYLLDVRLRCFTAGGRSHPWLALPSLLVLLAAVLVLLCSYGLAARAPELVRLTAGDTEDPTLRGNIGRALLAPVFAADGLATDQGALAKDILLNAILAATNDGLHNAYAAGLSAAEAALRAAERTEADEWEEPPSATSPGSAETNGTPDGAVPDGTAAAKAPEGRDAAPANNAPPATDAAATDAAKGQTSEQQPATGDGGATPEVDRAGRSAPDAAGAEQAGAMGLASGEAPMTATLERLALRWLTAADAPGSFAPALAGDQTDAAPEEAGLPEFLAGLVDEIQDGVTLEREGWEHVAGSRFVTTALSPWLAGQLRYLAGLLALIVVVFLAGWFFLLSRLVRWLNAAPEQPRAEPQAPPQAGRHAA